MKLKQMMFMKIFIKIIDDFVKLKSKAHSIKNINHEKYVVLFNKAIMRQHENNSK